MARKTAHTPTLIERLSDEGDALAATRARKTGEAEALQIAAQQALVDAAIAEGHAAAVDKALDILVTAGVRI